MLRAMLSAISGLRAHQTMMDVVGHNIANVNTPGYKTSRVVFEEALSEVIGGSSQAGETPNGGLRSYASMTYAGLKSLIYAGLGPDDPRVEAAVKWISRHYDLESNPGLGSAGLYYYYHTFAKTLDALDKDSFVDASGKSHDWQAEMVAALAKRQQTDGSWVNEDNPRWLEGDKNLVTAYALLTLAHCRPNSPAAETQP